MNQTYKDAIGMKRSYEDIIDRPQLIKQIVTAYSSELICFETQFNDRYRALTR